MKLLKNVSMPFFLIYQKDLLFYFIFNIYIYTIDTQDKVMCNENMNYAMIQNKEEG